MPELSGPSSGGGTSGVREDPPVTEHRADTDRHRTPSPAPAGDPEVLRYTAFSTDPAGGNPAGIVLDARALSPERMLAVAAEAIGASDGYIMLRELLPNIMAPIIVAATLNVARAILAESYISYLGYGIQPPAASWGNMLNNAQEYLESAPWLALLPGAVITLAVTSFNFIGDGLRDALDPRLDRAA